jgi:hypothetical protein
LAIDPLQRIIEVAAQTGILKPALPKATSLRCSLYDDDAAIFVDPSALELDRLHKILNFFGECSGLKINISKMEIFPIRIETSVVDHLLQNFMEKCVNSWVNTSDFTAHPKTAEDRGTAPN